MSIVVVTRTIDVTVYVALGLTRNPVIGMKLAKETVRITIVENVSALFILSPPNASPSGAETLGETLGYLCRCYCLLAY
jgi:hypothetical protein